MVRQYQLRLNSTTRKKMITELPEQLAAEAMGFLVPRDIDAACHALRSPVEQAEAACWCALARPFDQIELYAAEETWRSLYAAQAAIARIVIQNEELIQRPSPESSVRNIARFLLTGLRGHRPGGPRYKVGATTIMLAERALVEIAPFLSRQRLVAAARRLGSDGKWEFAAKLLRAALADDDDAAADADAAAVAVATAANASATAELAKFAAADESTAISGASPNQGGLLRRIVDWLRTRGGEISTPRPREAARVRRDALAPRWAAQLRIEASTFLVDRLYASTYVYATSGDGLCVSTALREGRAAVRALEALDEDDATPAPTDTRRAEATLPPLAYQLAEARLAYGRAAALCAQHVALGASHSDEDWHQIFDEGAAAFVAVRYNNSDGVQRARAAAGLAELWYCRASAQSLRLHDHESVEAVRRLARDSIAKTHEALAEIRALGLGETRLAATMLKDLGKVHGFLASIFGGTDSATGREFLAEALRIQQRLDRPAECETENIQRLLHDPAQAATERAELAADILTLDGDHIDVVLQNVEQQLLDQPDGSDDDD